MDEIKQANDALKTDLSKQKDAKDQELNRVRSEKDEKQEEYESQQKAYYQYQEILKERKRYIAYEYMKLNHTDIQELIDMLKTQFENIKLTDLNELCNENAKGEGLVASIEKSQDELEKIRAELEKFPIQEDDLRIDFFRLIRDILLDDISKRLDLNHQISSTIIKTSGKLRKHGERQQPITEDARKAKEAD